MKQLFALTILGIAVLALASCEDEAKAAGEAVEKGKEAGEAALEKGQETADDIGARAAELMKAAKEKFAALEIPDGVPGIPDPPKLTGNKKKDKASLLSALDSLKQACDRNDDRLAELAKKGITTATKEVEDIKRNNAAYQKVANALQDLIDMIQGG